MLTSILLQINEMNSVAVQTVAQTGVDKLSVMDLAVKGGWIMIVLLILSIIAVYIFIERYIAINKSLKEDASFMNSVREFIHNGNIEGAKSLAKSSNTPIARMIEKGLSRLGRPLPDINAAIENVGNLEVSRLERGVSMVGTIAGVGPMIGFLGTVTGMVRAFFDMSKAGNNIDIQLLSGGIYEAMITTVGGLIVGIVAYLLYNLLITRIICYFFFFFFFFFLFLFFFFLFSFFF